MRRALYLLAPLLLLVPARAHAQQASPEDFGLPPSQQPAQPAQPGQPAQPAPSQPVAVQPAPAPAPPAIDPEKDEAKGKEFRPALKLQLGYQLAHTYGIPIYAGRGRLGVGAQNDQQAHFMTFSSMVGETESERRAWDLRFGYAGELRLAGIVRLGIGIEVGYLFIRRATVDERMWALGIGVNAHVGVDVVTWGPRDDHALYVDAQIEGHIHFGNADLWGPTLSVGVRF